MITFSRRQKSAVYAAVSRAWRRAMEAEPVWRDMTAHEQRLYFRNELRRGIMELPEKPTFWETVKSWATGKEP